LSAPLAYGRHEVEFGHGLLGLGAHGHGLFRERRGLGHVKHWKRVGEFKRQSVPSSRSPLERAAGALLVSCNDMLPGWGHTWAWGGTGPPRPKL